MASENIKEELSEFEPALGMIIQIVAPSDERFHKKLFLIDYLDNDLMKIIDESYTTHKLSIINGELSEKSIQYIVTIKEPLESGYAKLNGMTLGTWWSIEYNPRGENGLPAIYNGEITNLDEDQIEFSILNDEKEEKDIIYIDFEYKGIPLDMPVKFYKLSKPNISTSVSSISEITQEDDFDIDNIDFDEPVIDSEGIREKQKEFIIQANNIEFRILEETIVESIEKAETEKIYDITDQTDDLLNSLLSTIKSNDRTPKRLEQVNIIINRYKELRNNFSNFDPLGNSNSSKKFGHEYRPIVEQLKSLSKNINWVIPIVKNKQNIYFDKKLSDETIENDIIPKNSISFQDDYDIQQSYLKRNIVEGINKYDYLTNSTFKPNFTNPDDNRNIVSLIDGDNSKKAKTNLFTYVDNLDDVYSSSIDNNNNIQKGRFNTSVYNTQFNRLNHIQKDINEIVLLKKGQTVPIHGFMIFPYSHVNYSQSTFKQTSILKKANLNLTPFRFFDFLYKEKFIDTNFIKTNEFKADPILQKSNENFLKNIKLIYFDEHLSYEDRNKEQNFTDLLNSIFPQIKELLESMNFDGCVSYERLLFKLQPFFITNNHITFQQYQKITEIIENEINYYRKTKSMLIKNCNEYLQNLPDSYISQSELLDIIPDLDDVEYSPTADYSEPQQQQQQVILDKSVKNAYDIKKTDQPSEYLYKTLNLDNSRYLYDACVFSQLNLSNDINIEDVVAELKTKIEAVDMNLINYPADECGPKVLSKRYANIENLMDEEYEAYFDTTYDETRYDIYNELNHINTISDKQQQRKMLINHLITEIEVPEDDAILQAESMIAGKKKIKNGHYAVLDDGTGDFRYYVRQDGVWQMDEELSGLSPEEINFCNTKNSCIKIKDKCTSIAKSQEEAQLDLMKDMLNKVQNELVKNTDEMKMLIKSDLQKDLKRIIILKNYIEKNTYKFDKYKHDIAMLFNSLDLIRSPNIDLRDQVLSTQDIVQKFERIIKFKEKHCREANLESGDDTNWYYCNITTDKSVKLLPTFMYELAVSFNTNIDLYIYTLEQIKKERGKISDDGDKIIDKYSGYEICKIEYSTDEGFEKSGAKKISRGLLDTSSEKKMEEERQKLLEGRIDTIDFETEERVDKKEEALNVFVEYMKKVIPALDMHLGINTSPSHQFIENYVIDLMDKKLTSASGYEKQLKVNPDLKTYKKYKGEFFLYSLLGMYAVAIQTQIPHINRGTGFSKCVESFKGFPLDKGNDFLHYLICVCIILRGPNKKAEFPFVLLPKYKEKKKLENELKHVKILKSFISDKILSIPAIKDKLQSKIEFLQDNVYQIEQEMHFDYKNWTTFLPPLVEFNIEKLISPNKDFENILMKSFSDKNLEENNNYILTLTSKIRTFSLSVQEDIQRIISERPVDSLFLKSQDGSTVFLENACCNETNDSPYKYFIDNQKNQDIKNHNEEVFKLSNIYNNYKKLLKVQLLYSPENTRPVKLTMTKDFTENTIYLAFIKYCKFNSNTILSEELRDLCHTNISEFKPLQSLEEKIDILKSENHNYNRTSLNNLLTILGRNNLQHIEKKEIISTKIQFEKITNTFKDNFSIKDIYTELNSLLDRYDISYGEKTDVVVTELLSKLDSETDKLLSNLNSFLSNKRKSNPQKKILRNLKNVKDIPLDDVKKGGIKYISKEDENSHFLYRFLLMISKQIANDFPINLIQTKKKSSKIECPLRWEFSQSHFKSLENSLFKELEGLNQFRADDELNEILKSVVKENVDAITIFENIPFFSRLGEMKTIFDGPVIQKLSYYMFLSILNSYTTIIERKFGIVENMNRIETGKALGKKAYLQNKVTELMIVYLNIIKSYKSNLFLNRFQIMEKVKKEIEYERAEVTSKYATLTDDEKDVEHLKQKHKLGEWSVGATKAIFQYDQEYTEQQMANLERRTLLEFQAGKEDNVSMDRVQALDLSEEVDKLLRERESQQLINAEYDTRLVFGEDEDQDDLEQYDMGMGGY